MSVPLTHSQRRAAQGPLVNAIRKLIRETKKAQREADKESDGGGLAWRYRLQGVEQALLVVLRAMDDSKPAKKRKGEG